MKPGKPRWRRIALLLLAGGVCIALAVHARARMEVKQAAAGRMYRDVASMPAREAGLVLGTSRLLANGERNLYFYHRIDAAATLYHAGKLRYLLVSGDNRSARYDEPAQMRAALMEHGVPASAIYCDYAGITTLDSVARAREVFGLDGGLIIISQGFHNQRALYLAQNRGIDAIALNARDVERRYATPTLAREQVARMRAWWDVHVGAREPRHLGPRIMVGSAPSSCKD